MCINKVVSFLDSARAAYILTSRCCAGLPWCFCGAGSDGWDYQMDWVTCSLVWLAFADTWAEWSACPLAPLPASTSCAASLNSYSSFSLKIMSPEYSLIESVGCIAHLRVAKLWLNMYMYLYFGGTVCHLNKYKDWSKALTIVHVGLKSYPY